MSRETRNLLLICALALLVGGGAAAAQAGFDSGGSIVLTGVLAIATVAYAGFTWRLVTSAEADRAQLTARDERLEHGILQALLREMQSNCALPARQASHSWIRFERGAYLESRRLHTTLPDELQDSLQQMDAAVARFNTLVEYNEQKVPPGNGLLDGELREAALAAEPLLVAVSDQLAAHLKSRPGSPAPARSTTRR